MTAVDVLCTAVLSNHRRDVEREVWYASCTSRGGEHYWRSALGFDHKKVRILSGPPILAAGSRNLTYRPQVREIQTSCRILGDLLIPELSFDDATVAWQHQLVGVAVHYPQVCYLACEGLPLY